MMRALKKGQAKSFQTDEGIHGEIELIERCFYLGKSSLSKVRKMPIQDSLLAVN